MCPSVCQTECTYEIIIVHLNNKYYITFLICNSQ